MCLGQDNALVMDFKHKLLIKKNFKRWKEDKINVVSYWQTTNDFSLTEPIQDTEKYK